MFWSYNDTKQVEKREECNDFKVQFTRVNISWTGQLRCMFNQILALINTPVGSLQLNGNLLFFLHLQILIQQPMKHKEANQKQIYGLSRGWAPRVSNRTKSGNKCKTLNRN